MQKDDCDVPTILKCFMAPDKVEWKAMHGEMSASADNPYVVIVSANAVCHKKDQEVVQSCILAQQRQSLEMWQVRE